VALNGKARGLIAQRRCWILTSRCASPLLHAASKTSLWQAYPLISLPLQTTTCPSLCHCAPFTRDMVITISPRARMSLEDEHYIRVQGAICGNGY